MIGRRLGPCDITGRLGEGGMGEVYRAHDARLGRDIALKVLRPEVARDAVRLERFTREGRAVAALNHPHIVTIHSTEEADGVRFLTMEMVEGQALDALIPHDGLPVARFLQLALPLADALTAAHQKQITHRDLKPGNVMVAADGRLKVLDFGLARFEPGAAEPAIAATRSVLTSEGTLVGTMPYMSPEQIEGRALDARSDLFSLGVMFYEMLSGARPFAGPSSAALMSAILRDAPPPLTETRADVPEALARLVARCLEKRPEDRVQTARDVFNELRHLQQQIESGPPRTPGGVAAAATDPSPRVAVLPFTARGGDLATSLAEGLTDDVTTGLSRFPHLRVVPASSAAILTPETAMRAGVRYLLEGRVQGSGHAVRVTIRLVDADTGSNLWSQTFDRAITTTAFEVQDDVTSHVVATVGDTSGVLARSMAASLLQRPVEELSVRQLVLRFHAYVEHFQADEHARLRGGLERALEREPLVAEGWACLADLYEHEHSQRLNPLPDSLGRQRRAAQRAVEIDPHNQRGWTAMAAVHTFEHDRAALRVAAERAIALNPLDADTLGLCALFLSCAGDDDRAMELFERAARLKPQHPGWYHFTPFTTFYKRREYAAALAEAKRVALPQLPTTHISAAAAAARAGSAPEAQAAVDALRRLDVGFLEPEVARQAVALWIWDEEHVRNLVDGLQAAIAMAGTPPAEARPSSGPAVAAGLISIAAPSFAARGGDTATELADGLTEDITTGLARFSSLRVVEGAGAQFRVEGSVRVSGASLRIAARLVDASSGAHLWADQFDRETASGTLPIQDEIAARIVTALADENGGVLIRTAAASLKPRAVDDLTAGELILRFHAYAEQFLADEHAELRRGFEQAVAREPRHAAAWACLSILYAHEAVLGLNPRPDIAGRQRAAADRALALDSQDQTVWSALAMSAAFTRDLTGLRAACERIVSLNPLSAHGVATAAIFLVFAGDVDRAAALVRQVSAHTPHHQGWYNFVPFLEAYLAGEYARALEHAKRIRMPVFSWCQLSAAAAAGQVGKSAEAGAALESLRASHPHLLDPDAARQEWTAWFWQEAPVERLVEGLEKALDLVSSGDRASRRTSDDGMRIAVLAFTARGGEDATALADGLTGDVTTALARFPYLRVVAPGAVRAMGEARDFQEASARLGARFLLEGAVRGAPGQVRVSVHLADAESGAHLWAEAFDRSLAPGLFAVQDDIVGRVAATVADGGGVLVRTLAGPVKNRPIETLRVDELVLRYHGDFAEHFDAADHAALRDAFEAAVIREPASAPAWACLAIMCAVEIFFGLNPKPDPLARLRHAAERANRLDPGNQHAWVAMATAALFDQDRAALEAATERTIALNPFHPRSIATVGLYTVFSGDTARGTALVERSIALNSRYPGWYLLAPFLAAYERADFAEALRIARRIGMPNFVAGHLAAAAAAGRTGTASDATPALEALARFDPRLVQPQGAREVWSRWIWDTGTVDRLVQGLEQAVALVSAPPSPPGGAA